MRILYAAIDQVVPGTKGGSIHVTAVAEGLARLGHEVHALVTRGTGMPPASTVRYTHLPPPLGLHQLRWARSSSVGQIVEEFRPDVIMERYYNFGGEAILHARRVGALAVLEVNAPVVDYPGSRKALLDGALLVRPMQRWRERICAAADVIITPDPAILPASIPAGRILRAEWGADTERFRPGGETGEGLFFVDLRGIVAVFAGAFRNWHGAIHLARALKRLRSRGRTDIAGLFIGDGPELPHVREELRGVDNAIAVGALPHEDMPLALAGAHIGVAPFDLGQHKPLSLGFYWSPLKIYEYMAAGLPVVAPRAARIPDLVADGKEGLLYDPADPNALADTLERLTDDALRMRLGYAARQRAVREYSWAAHCAVLDERFKGARGQAVSR